MSEPKLDPDKILSHEFNYAAQTAFQANEDRVRVFHYYLATVGTLIAASVLANSTNDAYMKVFSLAMILLAFLGFIFLLKLIKLRISWKESVRAMCKIKKYYVKKYDELKEALLWEADTIPAVGKLWSVAFLMSLIIAILSSGSAGGAVYFWGLSTGRTWGTWALYVGVTSFLGQIFVWVAVTYVIDRKKEKEEEKEKEKEIEKPCVNKTRVESKKEKVKGKNQG